MHQPITRLMRVKARAPEGHDTSLMHRILTIAARAVGILGIGFVSLFALDVFGTGAPPLEIALGLVIHLMPNFILIAVLAIAWRWPLAGGIIYLGFAVVPFVLLSNAPWVNAMLAGPFALAGVLFVAAALTRDAPPGEARPKPSSETRS